MEVCVDCKKFISEIISSSRRSLVLANKRARLKRKTQSFYMSSAGPSEYCPSERTINEIWALCLPVLCVQRRAVQQGCRTDSLPRGLLPRLRRQQLRLGLYHETQTQGCIPISWWYAAGQPLVHLHSESLKLDFVYVSREARNFLSSVPQCSSDNFLTKAKSSLCVKSVCWSVDVSTVVSSKSHCIPHHSVPISCTDRVAQSPATHRLPGVGQVGSVSQHKSRRPWW